MPAYSITEVEIYDQDAAKLYAELAGAAIEQFGGRFLVRGVTPTVAEGDWPTGHRMVIIEFPTFDRLRAWYDSPAYAPARALARTALSRRLLFVEGIKGATHKDGLFSNGSGRHTYWQAWSPATPSKGAVLLIHTLAEHSGRYRYTASRLTGAGYAVYAADLHGHGKSAGVRGNVGRLGWAVDDVQSLRDMAIRDQPDAPIFILGRSLGALIALDYATREKGQGLAGVALAGIALNTNQSRWPHRAMTAVIGAVAPNRAVSELGIDLISGNLDVVRAFRADPLTYSGKLLARTRAEIQATTSRVLPRTKTLSMPLLVIHGAQDRLIPVDCSRLVYSESGVTDKTLKIYEGMQHEIFYERERDIILNDLVAWIDER